MPRNGTGTYNLPQAPFVPGTVISSATMNSDLNDIATALTGSLPRDGQAGMSGALKSSDGIAGAPSLTFTNEIVSGFYRPSAGKIGVAVSGVSVGFFDSGGWEGAVSGGTPIGSVIDYAGSTAPTRWLLCFGQAVSRTTYAILFGVIGTTYGVGDGATTFNVPDLRGLVSAGVDNMGGTPSGRINPTYFLNTTTSLSAIGGALAITLGTGNLPAYTPSGGVSVSNGAISINGQGAGTVAGAGAFCPGGGSFGSPVILTASQGASTASFVGNAQGGASVPFTNVQPTILMNKIIFAGV